MPRVMPRLDLQFSAQATLAVEIVRAGELARAGWDKGKQEWKMLRLEALYELAYLRTFAAWESLLEQIFYRSLCGFASSRGQETLVRGLTYYTTIRAAENAALGPKQFLLWHNPHQVIRRCQQFIQSGPGCLAIQESVVSSAVGKLEFFGAIRHRVVHEQADARVKFDNATLSLAGRIYPASRPGKFLRDIDPSSPTGKKWLEVLVTELSGLASQMV
jgi:hypothetical protein